jgi:hypothetical protein
MRRLLCTAACALFALTRRDWRPSLAALSLPVLLALSACGGGGEDSPLPIVALDSCTLLTAPDFSAVLGSTLTSKESSDQPTPKARCDFHQSNGISVVVFLFATDSAAAAFQFGKTNQGSNVSVSGVGDAAYWTDGIRTLNVLTGKIYFTVQFLTNGTPTPAPGQLQAEQLAQRIVPRLPH